MFKKFTSVLLALALFGTMLLGVMPLTTTTVQAAEFKTTPQIASLQWSYAFLKDDGTVWGMGGLFGLEGISTPQQIPGLSEVKGLFADTDVLLALKNDGTVWSAGNNYNGRLGIGSTDYNEKRTVPTQVANIADIVSVGATSVGGLNFGYYAVNKSGKTYLWGAAPEVLSYSSSINDWNAPIEIYGLNNIKKVNGNYALDKDGNVWDWGQYEIIHSDNAYGMSITKYQMKAPVKVAGLVSIADIDGLAFLGQNSSVYTISDGRVYGMENLSGVTFANSEIAILSNGTLWTTYPGGGYTTRSRQIQGISDVIEENHRFALKSDGTLWRFNPSGNKIWYGQGRSIPAYTTAETPITSGVKMILTQSGDDVYVLKNDGTVWLAGANGIAEKAFDIVLIAKTANGVTPTPTPENNTPTTLPSKVTLSFNVGLADEGKKNYPITIKWGDEIFSSKNSNYLNELAIAGLALSGAAEITPGKTGQELTETMLKQLGFSKVNSWYYTYDYNSADTVACSIASQQIYTDGEKSNIIVIVNRGSVGDILPDILPKWNWETMSPETKNNDWTSNFGGADAFNNAADKVYAYLEQYIVNAHIDTTLETKLFITGHSRGGAVANLLATKVSGIAHKGNTFVYSFASPKTNSGNTNVSGYNRFWNIVNGEDIIPMLSPLDKSRYGSDISFSRNEVNGIYDKFSEITSGKNLKSTMESLWLFDEPQKIYYAHDTPVYLAYLLSQSNLADTPSSWATSAVDKGSALGLVTVELKQGYQATTTRAEFCRAAVNFLRKYGYDVDSVTPKLFADTSDNNIGIAAALGITSGTDTAKNLFSPDGMLTREQAATMLRNVMKVIGKTAPASGVTWTDAKDISSWAKEASDIMYSAKIMGGTSTTALMFSPKTPYTHEQSIITLVNLWEYVKK